MSILAQLSARIKNIFTVGDFRRRYTDGKIQVKTVFNRVLEKKECFPYGFKARAKKGRVLVLCQGGNFDGFEILPVLESGDGPQLNDGDAALYTGSGGWVICRENGSVEINGNGNGGVVKVQELQTQLSKLTARVDAIIDALKNSSTTSHDGGAAYKAAIIVALNNIPGKENFANIASAKVLHGNG
jgi:phage gp45-like